MLSLNLQTMRLNAGDSKMSNDEEVRRVALVAFPSGSLLSTVIRLTSHAIFRNSFYQTVGLSLLSNP